MRGDPLTPPQGRFLETLKGSGSLLDSAVMKLLAIADRWARKDFLDLHAIIGSGIPLESVLDAVLATFPGAAYQRYTEGAGSSQGSRSLRSRRADR